MRGTLGAVGLLFAASGGCGSLGAAADADDGCVVIPPAPSVDDASPVDATIVDATKDANDGATAPDATSTRDATSLLDTAPAACRLPVDPGVACGAGVCVPSARMLLRHDFPADAALRDGRVVVVGGDPYRQFVEIYSPECDRWQPAHPSALQHGGVTGDTQGLPLDDGRALFVSPYGATAAYEIYDPAHDAWSPARPLPALLLRSPTRLRDGRWMLAGDLTCRFGVYDPPTDRWTLLPFDALPSNCFPQAATSLADGRVLAVVGQSVAADGGYVEVEHAFFFDPATSVWSETFPPPGPMLEYVSQPLITLHDGRVVAFGFEASWVFDPSTETWTAVTVRAGSFGSATLLPCGKVMLLGDYDLIAPSWRAVWDPETDVVTPMPASATLSQGAAVLLPDGRVLSFAGEASPIPISRLTHPRISTEMCR